MAFIGAVGKFFRRLFGIGEGALSNASDRILTANASTIRAQFRKVRNKLLKNHSAVRKAVANLMAINEEKRQEIQELNNKIDELETKKLGAVRKYKETEELKYQDAFKACHAQLERIKEKLKQDKLFVEQNTKNIEKYKRDLLALQNKVDVLKVQEDQAVADIVSSRQITELNNMLSGFSSDVDLQGLEVIEEARKKAVANAKLSTELSATAKNEIDKELLEAGSNIDEEFAKMLASEEKKILKKTEERKL